MNKSLFIIACLIMAVAIMLGAFGAHGLSNKLSNLQLNSFETAVRYQIIHALALLIISLAKSKLEPTISNWGTKLMLIGILSFSGSIYLITFGHVIQKSMASYLWWITPLGGLLLIISWVVVAISAAKSKAV